MSATGRRTIFVAEDNAILLQGLRRALSANGYAVEPAEDGPALLRLLEEAESPPHLVLLDEMMPGMTGLEVLRFLREDHRWANIPAMLITAAADEELSASARDAGAVDVLIKPFRLNELLERVARQVA